MSYRGTRPDRFSILVQALKNGQQELQARLNSTQSDEREARRNLSSAGEEMAAMREKHRDEVDELERKLSKKERERKELEDDCRDLKNELESSKGEVRDLKVSTPSDRSVRLANNLKLNHLRPRSQSRQHHSSRYRQSCKL